MRFDLLGPLGVSHDGHRVGLGPVKQRLLLATLLSRPSEPVPSAVLVAALWGEDPPASAASNLRTYARGLRSALGGGVPWDGMPRTQGGYLLRVEPGGRDVDLFDQATARGRRALTLADPAQACEELAGALGLWRGTVLEGLPLPDALERWAGRLEERRCHTEEDYAQALLAEDRCPEAVRRMRGLIERHPLRQRAWGHLMLGLYRAGDVAGALEAYRLVRGVLVQETGLEPGPELSRLHEDILRQRPESTQGRVNLQVTESAPRARGDGPFRFRVVTRPFFCSPRPRGWPQVLRHRSRECRAPHVVPPIRRSPPERRRH